MTRTACAVLLFATCVAACSHTDSQQSASQQSSAGQQEPSASQAPAGPPQAPASTTPPAAGEAAPRSSAPAATPPTGQAMAQQPPAPAPEPPAPQVREITIPAGTSFSITLLNAVASNASKVEDPVKGVLAKPVVVGGRTVVPAGAEISGTVTDAKESGRVKGRASVAFRFDRLVVQGEPYRIQTASVTREAEADTKKDVKKGAVGGGLGAVVGGVVGGGTGAAVGAVAGGSAAVLGTKGQEISLQPGTVVAALLQEPLTVTVRLKSK